MVSSFANKVRRGASSFLDDILDEENIARAKRVAASAARGQFSQDYGLDIAKAAGRGVVGTYRRSVDPWREMTLRGQNPLSLFSPTGIASNLAKDGGGYEDPEKLGKEFRRRPPSLQKDVVELVVDPANASMLLGGSGALGRAGTKVATKLGASPATAARVGQIARAGAITDLVLPFAGTLGGEAVGRLTGLPTATTRKLGLLGGAAADPTLGLAESLPKIGQGLRRAVPVVPDAARAATRAGSRLLDTEIKLPAVAKRLQGKSDVVPPDVARRMAQVPVGNVWNLPEKEQWWRKTIEDTPGMRIEPDGTIHARVVRNQKLPEPEEALRGGIFYAPSKSFYSNTGDAPTAEGGNIEIAGDTIFRNPLFVRDEVIHGRDKLWDYDHSHALMREADAVAENYPYPTGYGLDPDQDEKALFDKQKQEWLEEAKPKIASFVESWVHPDDQEDALRILTKNAEKWAAPDITHRPPTGLAFSTPMQERAISSHARAQGYDSIIAGERDSFVTEIMDIRESHYPTPSGGYKLHPRFEPTLDEDPGMVADFGDVVAPRSNEGDFLSAKTVEDIASELSYEGQSIFYSMVPKGSATVGDVTNAFEKMFDTVPSAKQYYMGVLEDALSGTKAFANAPAPSPTITLPENVPATYQSQKHATNSVNSIANLLTTKEKGDFGTHLKYLGHWPPTPQEVADAVSRLGLSKSLTKQMVGIVGDEAIKPTTYAYQDWAVKAGLVPAQKEIPDSLYGLTDFEPLGGSTGAMKVLSPDGEFFVKKKGASPDHLFAESVADQVYEAAGVPVAPHKVVFDEQGHPVKLAVFESGRTLNKLTDPKEIELVHKELRKGFVADVVLGNRDVVGLANDNIILTNDGRVLRIDNGSSFDFRAQGGYKDYTEDPSSELNGLRNPSLNKTAAAVYGPITDEEIAEQAATLDQQKYVIANSVPQKYRETLFKRIEWMAEHYPKKAKQADAPLFAGESHANEVIGMIADAMDDNHAYKFSNAIADIASPDWPPSKQTMDAVMEKVFEDGTDATKAFWKKHVGVMANQYAPGLQSGEAAGFVGRQAGPTISARDIGRMALSEPVLGAAVGATVPADSPQERIRNAGAGFVLGGGVAGVRAAAPWRFAEDATINASRVIDESGLTVPRGMRPGPEGEVYDFVAQNPHATAEELAHLPGAPSYGKGMDDLRAAGENGVMGAFWYSTLGKRVAQYLGDNLETWSADFTISTANAPVDENLATAFRAFRVRMEMFNEGILDPAHLDEFAKRMKKTPEQKGVFASGADLRSMYNAYFDGGKSYPWAKKRPSFFSGVVSGARGEMSLGGVNDVHMARYFGDFEIDPETFAQARADRIAGMTSSPAITKVKKGIASAKAPSADASYIFMNAVTDRLAGEVGVPSQDMQAAIWATSRSVFNDVKGRTAKISERGIDYVLGLKKLPEVLAESPVVTEDGLDAAMSYEKVTAELEKIDAMRSAGLADPPPRPSDIRFEDVRKKKHLPPLSHATRQADIAQIAAAGAFPEANVAFTPGYASSAGLAEKQAFEDAILSNPALYNPQTQRFPILDDLNIPHKVEQTGLTSTWDDNGQLVAEPHLRMTVQGNQETAEYVGATLGALFHQDGTGILREVPRTENLALLKLNLDLTPDEAMVVAETAAKHGVNMDTAPDGRVFFPDYGGERDEFVRRVGDVVDELGYPREGITVHPGESHYIDKSEYQSILGGVPHGTEELGTVSPRGGVFYGEARRAGAAGRIPNYLRAYAEAARDAFGDSPELAERLRLAADAFGVPVPVLRPAAGTDAGAGGLSHAAGTALYGGLPPWLANPTVAGAVAGGAAGLATDDEGGGIGETLTRAGLGALLGAGVGAGGKALLTRNTGTGRSPLRSAWNELVSPGRNLTTQQQLEAWQEPGRINANPLFQLVDKPLQAARELTTGGAPDFAVRAMVMAGIETLHAAGPKAAGDVLLTSLTASRNQGSFNQWMAQNAKKTQDIRAFARKGANIATGTPQGERSIFAKMAEKSPFLKPLGGLAAIEEWTFNRFIPVLATEAANKIADVQANSKRWGRMYTRADILDMTDERLTYMMIGQDLDALGMSKDRQAIERMIAFAPGYGRGQVRNMVAPGKVKVTKSLGPVPVQFQNSYESAMAQRFWATAIALGMSTAIGGTYLAFAAAGEDPGKIQEWVDPTNGKSITNPFSPNFMAVVTADGTRIRMFPSLVTPARTMFAPFARGIQDAAEAHEQAKIKGEGVNALTLASIAGVGASKQFIDSTRQFLTNKASIPVRTIMDVARNKNQYTGRQMYDPKGNLFDKALDVTGKVAISAVPIFLQPQVEPGRTVPEDVQEGQSRGFKAGESVAEFFGLGLYPGPQDPEHIKNTVSTFLESQGIHPGTDPLYTYRTAGAALDSVAKARFENQNKEVQQYIREKRRVDFERKPDPSAGDVYRQQYDHLRDWKDEALRQLENNMLSKAWSGDQYRHERRRIFDSYNGQILDAQKASFGHNLSEKELGQAASRAITGDREYKQTPVMDAIDKLYAIEPLDDSPESMRAYFQSRNRYMDSLDPKMKADVIDILENRSATETEREYQRASRKMSEYMEIPAYDGYTVEESDKIARIVARARDLADLEGISVRSAIWSLDEDPDMLDAADLANRGKITNPDRRIWRDMYWRDVVKFYSSLVWAEELAPALTPSGSR